MIRLLLLLFCMQICVSAQWVWEDDQPYEEFIRGDVNEDGKVNRIDLVILIKYLTGGEPLRVDAADVDNDGYVDLGDALYLHNYLQGLGPEPEHPFPDCGLPRACWRPPYA